MRTSVMTVLLWHHWDALEYKILSGILRTAGAKYIFDYRDKNIDFLEFKGCFLLWAKNIR
jgi:hypothetical protein